MSRLLCIAITVVLFCAASVFADTLSGTILHKDGSKVAKTSRISTSFNSNTATYPANGEYKLDFGAKVGKRITVYVDGDRYIEIEVKGDTKLNIKLKK